MWAQSAWRSVAGTGVRPGTPPRGGLAHWEGRRCRTGGKCFPLKVAGVLCLVPTVTARRTWPSVHAAHLRFKPRGQPRRFNSFSDFPFALAGGSYWPVL